MKQLLSLLFSKTVNHFYSFERKIFSINFLSKINTTIVQSKFLLLSLWSLIISFHISGYANPFPCELMHRGIDNYTSRDLAGCCNKKLQEFGTFWPSNNCECTKVTDNLKRINDNCVTTLGKYAGVGEITLCIQSKQGDLFNKQIEPCIKKAEEEVKSAIKSCKDRCYSYIDITTIGCPKAQPNVKSSVNCQNICSSNVVIEEIKSMFVYEQELSTSVKVHKQIEKNISNRNECIGESKKEFIKVYTAQCVDYMNRAQKAKGEQAILLCEKNATKTDNGCENYCKEMLSKFYGTGLNSDEISRLYTADNDELGSGSGFKLSAYGALVNGYRTGLNMTLKEKLKEYITSAGVITTLGEKEGLHWLLFCKGDDPCAGEIETALNEAVETCAEVKKEASDCCHKPEQCVGGGLARALDGLGKLNVAVSGMRGIKAQCEAVQQTHGMYGGMQGMMASQCTSKTNTCVSECSDKINKFAKVFKKYCNHDPRTKGVHNENHTCEKKEVFDKYQTAYRKSDSEKGITVSKVVEECKTTGKEANRRINDMNTNLATGLLAAMQECEEMVKENGEMETPPPSTPPPVASQGRAQGPGLPELEVDLGGGGSEEEQKKKALGSPDDLSVQQAANPFDTEPEMGDPVPKMGEGVKSGLGGVLGGSSGGGGLGGLGSGGGGGSGGGYKAAPSKGKKRKILLGFKGGKFAGYGGGGSDAQERSGRRSFRGKKEKRKTASLDLKKLLPKGKQLNHKIGKFGSPHDDIFQRLSDRFQWMCKTKKIPCN